MFDDVPQAICGLRLQNKVFFFTSVLFQSDLESQLKKTSSEMKAQAWMTNDSLHGREHTMTVSKFHPSVAYTTDDIILHWHQFICAIPETCTNPKFLQKINSRDLHDMLVLTFDHVRPSYHMNAYFPSQSLSFLCQSSDRSRGSSSLIPLQMKMWSSWPGSPAERRCASPTFLMDPCTAATALSNLDMPTWGTRCDAALLSVTVVDERKTSCANVFLKLFIFNCCS